MSNTVKIGQLKSRITLQKFQPATDTTGEKIETEVPYKTIFSYVQDVTGSESEEGKILALSVRKYIIRYDVEVLKNGVKMLVFDETEETVYNINSVEQIGFKNYLALKCSKRE